MSQSRLNLQRLLETITPRVYFQKPSKITVPCIVYEKSNNPATKYAGNKKYMNLPHYVITYIKDDPDDDEVTDKLDSLLFCSFDRRFISGNLYHDVFDLYYKNEETLNNKEEKK